MEDRISSLPDSIISHILSFLPTKSSAATCILSKRWKPLWLSVLHLHFDCKRFFKDYTTFRHVVYLVMLSRQYAVPIQSLSLRLEGCKRIDIDNSVNAAVKQGLQTLELIMGFSWTKYHLENKLSLNVFNCKTSKNLRLIDLPRQIFPFSIQVPTFHNLIQLELVFCNFNSIIWDKKSTWMIEMLQHSPNLQHLTIHQETEDGNYDDNRQDPENIPKCVSSQLRTLVLREWRGTHSEFQFLQYVLENSTVLHTVTIHHHAKSITLYASQRLEELCRLHLRRARPPLNFRFSYG